MAVSIPVSADASGVLAAFAEIERAIDRAGQAGRKMAQLDLSHPELKQFAADLQRIQQRFEDLNRIGRGPTAQNVRGIGRTTGATDPMGWLQGTEQAFATDEERRRHVANVGRYIFQGTQFAPRVPPPTQPPQPPGVAGATQSILGGIQSGAAAGAGIITGGVGGLLAAVGLGVFASAISKVVEMAQTQGLAVNTLMRQISGVGSDFDTLRTSIREASQGLGLTSTEATRLASTYARMAGDQSPESVLAGMRTGVGFARSYGMEPETGVAAMGRASFLGQDPRQFALLIGDAIQRGGQTGQAEQVTATFVRALEQTAGRMINTADTVASMGRWEGLYATLNDAGEKRGMSGLRGEGAVNILNSMNAAMMQGGNAGMASQIFTMRAFGAAGITNPYEVEDIRERGMFARRRGANGQEVGPTVLEMNIAEMARQYGGTDRFRLRHIMERQWGISHPAAEALQNVFGPTLQGRPGHAGMAGSMGIGDTAAYLQRTLGHDVFGDNLTQPAFQSLFKLAGANPEELDAARKEMLDRTGSGALNTSERTMLSGLQGNDLRDALVRLTAERGEAPTDASRMREALAALQSALTELGGKLLPVATKLTEEITKLVGAIQPIVDYLTQPADFLNKANEMGQSAAKWAAEKLGLDPKDIDFTKEGDGVSIGPDPIGDAIRRFVGGGGSGGGRRGGSGGGRGRVSTNPATDALKVEYRDWLMNDPDLRMSLGGASGVVSRLMNESDLDPKAYNPEEDAHGIAQWRLDRWTRLQAKAKEWGLDPDSKEANKRFLKLEMLERPRFLKFLQDPYTDAFQAGYRMGGPEFENADSGNWAIGAEAGPGIARLPSALATGRKPFALASPNDTSIPGSSAAGAPGASTSIVRIDPLTVVHQNPWGDVLHTQTLPTHVSAPQPTNPPAQTSPATGPSTQQPGPRNLPTPPIPPTQPPPRFNWSMVTP